MKKKQVKKKWTIFEKLLVFGALIFIAPELAAYLLIGYVGYVYILEPLIKWAIKL